MGFCGLVGSGTIGLGGGGKSGTFGSGIVGPGGSGMSGPGGVGFGFGDMVISLVDKWNGAGDSRLAQIAPRRRYRPIRVGVAFQTAASTSSTDGSHSPVR
jgi:hypothetical protein